MAEDAAMENQLTSEELQNRYKEAKRFTTGALFGKGDGHLGPEVRDEVIRRNEARKNKETAKIRSNKTKLQELAADVEGIRHQQATDLLFTLIAGNLGQLVQWKKQKGNAAMPSRKKDLQKQWNETKSWQSPHISTCISDAEDDGDDDGVDPGEEEDDAIDSDDKTDKE